MLLRTEHLDELGPPGGEQRLELGGAGHDARFGHHVRDFPSRPGPHKVGRGAGSEPPPAGSATDVRASTTDRGVRRDRPGRVARGAAAGAVGTLALNAVTYLDIAVRGRPPSRVPEDVVAHTVERRGISLSEHRRAGIAALGGYATGVCFGGLVGAVRPALPRWSPTAVGLAVGAAAMAATDTGATLAGATDPRGWSIADWLADVVPHAVYGLTTVVTFDRLWAGSDLLRPGRSG